MSVFKEKNGRCEGANLLCGMVRFQVSPGWFSTSRGLSLGPRYIGAASLRSAGRRSVRPLTAAYTGIFGKGGDSEQNS